MAKKNPLTSSRKQRALALIQANRFEEASALYKKICEIDKWDGEAWFLRGALMGMLGRHAEAAQCSQNAIKIQPGNAEAHYNFGVALRNQRKFSEAAEMFRATLKLQRGHPRAQDGLAHALMALGQLEEAAGAFQDALEASPEKPEVHSNLGSIFQSQGFLAKAETCYRTAQRLGPDLSSVYDNLGTNLCMQGRYEEAIASYRDGLRRHPHNARLHSNLLLTLNYLPQLDQQKLFMEHCAWGEIRPHVTPAFSFPNSRDAQRRLRIGYVSQDLRTHSVAYFIEPLLKAHDPSRVETYCYADVASPDATTTRIRSLVKVWRDIAGVPDGEAAKQIQADKIDILVDLAGHTGGSRLAIFRYKPAPIQVAYLGYPNTTGIRTMDYRLTDTIADPPGQEVFHTEQLTRLPGCFLCYQPPANAPEVAPLPFSKNKHITFGSFNSLAKINTDVIAVWSKILCAEQNAQLVIKNHSLTDVETRARFHQLFAQHGVSNERVVMVGSTRDSVAHLEWYGQIDIGLDTFPYNGTTTTCEALWMGVPVVSLAGRSHAGRVGASLLAATGLNHLLTESEEAYVCAARTLAADTHALATLRSTLRERVRVSRLCDSKVFAQNVEAAFKEMWGRWCETD